MAAAERCVRIAIIDPHELTVAGLTQVLTQCRSPHFRVVPPEHANPPADIVLYNVEQHSGGSHDPALHALIRQTRSTVIACSRGPSMKS